MREQQVKGMGMILVTGALGFIGAHTTRALIDAGQTVVAACHKSTTAPDFLAPKVGKTLILEQVDLLSIDALRHLAANYGVESILHLAAPPLGALDPSTEYRHDMGALINLLDIGREFDLRRVSIASSIAVYLGVEQGPFLERAPLRLTPSASTEAFKKACEVLGSYYAQRLSMDVVFIRIAQTYGPGYRSLFNLPSRMVHVAAHGRLPEGAAAPEAFEDDGADYCYVKDCASGLQRLHMAPRLQHTTYNLGAGRAITPRELLEAIQTVKPDVEISLRAGRSPNATAQAFMSIDRAAADVGYQPQYSPATAVRDYIDWLAAGHTR
jgi:UDP-glucose 4-epimerase